MTPPEHPDLFGDEHPLGSATALAFIMIAGPICNILLCFVVWWWLRR